MMMWAKKETAMSEGSTVDAGAMALKITALETRNVALEAMLRECLWYVGEYESNNESNRALSVITRANALLRDE